MSLSDQNGQRDLDQMRLIYSLLHTVQSAILYQSFTKRKKLVKLNGSQFSTVTPKKIKIKLKNSSAVSLKHRYVEAFSFST